MNATARSACAVFIALAAFAASAASDPPSTRWAYDLAQELLSPFCPGRSLADCPSPDAASVRMWIIEQAGEGRSRADVEEELYARYGEAIRAKPKVEGLGAGAYLIPLGVFAGGGGLVAWFLRRAIRRAPSAEPVRGLDPEVDRKVDELLGVDRGEGSDSEVGGR